MGSIIIVLITIFCSAGSLVMIGGNLQEDNQEIWNTLVNLAGGANVYLKIYFEVLHLYLFIFRRQELGS